MLLLSRAMEIKAEDLVHHYGQLGDAELIEIAQSYDSLTDVAQAALRKEFARRNLEPPVIEVIDSPAATSRELVTLRRYRDLSEAIVARSLLESAGITAYLREENLVRLDWQISNAVGGIRLQVEAADAQAAAEFLAQPIPDSIPFGDQAEFVQPRCPRCGSLDITFEGSSRGAALTSLYVLSLPVPSGRKTWLCSSCEARWEDTGGDAATPPGV
jgi:hypothetical protein